MVCLKKMKYKKEPPKNNVAQAKAMAPPAPVQLYQFEEFENGVFKISEILEKIKIKLKIDTFQNLANYLEK